MPQTCVDDRVSCRGGDLCWSLVNYILTPFSARREGFETGKSGDPPTCGLRFSRESRLLDIRHFSPSQVRTTQDETRNTGVMQLPKWCADKNHDKIVKVGLVGCLQLHDCLHVYSEYSGRCLLHPRSRVSVLTRTYRQFELCGCQQTQVIRRNLLPIVTFNFGTCSRKQRRKNSAERRVFLLSFGHRSLRAAVSKSGTRGNKGWINPRGWEKNRISVQIQYHGRAWFLPSHVPSVFTLQAFGAVTKSALPQRTTAKLKEVISATLVSWTINVANCQPQVHLEIASVPDYYFNDSQRWKRISK